MSLHKVLFLLLLFFSFTTIQAQEEGYALRHFTTDNGLSHNSTSVTFQDSRQFVWVGTRFGLNQFDGNEFKAFTKRKNGVEQNLVQDILEDQQGKLWVVFSEQMISILDVNTEQAISFDEHFPNVPFRNKDIRFVQSDKDKNIWVLTKNGNIFRWDKNWKLLSKHKKYKTKSAFNIIDENEIYVYGRSNGEVLKINATGEIVDSIFLDIPIDKVGMLSEEIFWVSRMGQYQLENRLQAYDWKGNKKVNFLKFESDSLQNSSYSFQLKDEQGRFQLWHVGGNMLLVTNSKGDTIADFSNLIFKKNLGNSIFTKYVSKDQFNNIWITSNLGLFLLSPKRNLFKTFLSQKNSLKNNYSVRGIDGLDNENIFVATYHGFFKVDKKSNEIDKINVASCKNNYDKSWRYGLGILTIGDTILSGFHGPSFWIFDKQSLDCELVFLDLGNEVHFFYKDQFEQIWVGADHGLFLLNLKTKTVDKPPSMPTQGDFSQVSVYHILENKKELLMGTELGLFAINHSGEVLEYFEDLITYRINFIHQINDHQYWLATRGNGIIYWDRKTNEHRQFTKEQGLTDDYIYSIHEDEFGLLWLPSNNGLMRFNPKDFSINTFNESDGIANNEFNYLSHYVAPDGQMYFGGTNGVTTFHPRDFQDLEKKNTPFRITSAQKMREGETEFSKVEIPQEINFNPSDKAIELEFCLFDYVNSFQSKYAYQIEGHDGKWNYLNDNRLKINRLPYGDYILNVKAQGENGVWSNQLLTIPLYVLKPFYLKWQFLLLSFLALAVAIYSIFRWRITRLEKMNLALENTVAERTKELKDLNNVKDQFFAIIAHDLRAHVISFRNVSKKVNFLKRKGTAKELDDFFLGIDKSAEGLGKLLDNLLNWALVEKGIFPHHPEMINLKEMVEENVNLFQQMSQLKEVKLEYEIPEEFYFFADKNAVLTIIRNLMSNAIKFSRPGDKIVIHADQKNNQIQIQDSGIGITAMKLQNIFELDTKNIKRGTKGEKGTGLGLRLCKELVELNQGDIKIQSEEGKGTIVMVKFPRSAA